MKNTFSGKTVLITGHTGFKGAWLSIWLVKLGANVVGYSDRIHSPESLYVKANLQDQLQTVLADINNYDTLDETIREHNPDFVFHLAAQAIVSSGFDDPTTTFLTNAMGTECLLRALRNNKSSKVRNVVIITSDKCYENIEQNYGYREHDRLGGKDPYSASKACAEIIISSYVRSFFNHDDIRIAIGRAGNVIGGGDWTKDRVVPDCFRSWYNESVVKIRSKASTRPWQHVLEPLFGYINLAVKLDSSHKIKNGEAYNFGPHIKNNVSVETLVQKLFQNWTKLENKDNSTTKGWTFSSEEHFSESKLLQLDISKAFLELDWQPVLSIDECCELTTKWYHTNKHDPSVALRECENQIDSFSRLALQY